MPTTIEATTIGILAEQGNPDYRALIINFEPPPPSTTQSIPIWVRDQLIRLNLERLAEGGPRAFVNVRLYNEPHATWIRGAVIATLAEFFPAVGMVIGDRAMTLWSKERKSVLGHVSLNQPAVEVRRPPIDWEGVKRSLHREL